MVYNRVQINQTVCLTQRKKPCKNVFPRLKNYFLRLPGRTVLGRTWMVSMEQTKQSLLTYGIQISNKCRSDCILSAVCTEPRLWIAQCPLRGRANQSLIPLQRGPNRVTRTIQWQQVNTPSDPGVRSLRNHGESSFASSNTMSKYWKVII